MKLIKIVLIILSVWSATLYAEEERVDVNFRDLSVRDFIEMVSKITQKNILIQEDLQGKINFVSATPIKKSSLIPLANSILGGKGLTLIDQGEYYKVVKSADAAAEGVPVSNSVDGGTIKTVMFPLRHSNAAVIRAKIKPLLRKSDKVVSFKENNVLAITAAPRTLQAVSKIIKAVEGKGEKKSIVLKLRNSSVKDVFSNARSMSMKLFPQTVEGEKVDILKDEATNSIILIGKPENNNRMIKYIKQLDIQGDRASQQMYVIRLKNSNVEEMEKILSKLILQMNNMSSSTSLVTGGRPIVRDAKGAVVPGQVTKNSVAPVSKAMVVSDVERNALIVLASTEQIRNIRETVAKIDIPKVQVYVKARIVEINTNLAEQIGIRYGFEGGNISSKGLFSAAANFGASSLMISPTLMGFLNQATSTTVYNDAGNPIGTESDAAFKFDTGISDVFALGAKIDLLKQNGAAHILSEPSILCTNNKESIIQVGQTQSILTQAQQTTQGQGNIINNYSREDIGITLKVKPRLSSNNQVTLEVEAEVEDILPGSSASADRPTTTKRKVVTNAIVNNGETIILGGLMKSAGGKNITKIPILGDIPILGKLFTSSSDAESQVNVVIYLTPYIVRKSGDLKRLRTALSELEDIQVKYNIYVKKGLNQGIRHEVQGTKKYSPASRRIRRTNISNLSILEEE